MPDWSRMHITRRDRGMVAVSVMLDVAFHGGRSALVSAAEVAERLGTARRGIEPLLQALSREGLLDSVRGPRGGYRIGRPAREIRLSEIVAVALSENEEGMPRLSGRLQAAVLDRLWDELDAAVREHLAALTLEDLLRRAARAGLNRPAEPINFTI